MESDSSKLHYCKCPSPTAEASTAPIDSAAGERHLKSNVSGVLEDTSRSSRRPERIRLKPLCGSMTEFEDKVALVTGAASGIGAAVAAHLHANGAHVFWADLNSAGLERAAGGGRAISLDVREEAAWATTSTIITNERGRLDILVNCVGVSAASPLTDTPLSEWRHVMSTNLDGAFLATRFGMRALQPQGGAIVHIGSASGIRPSTGAAAYSTSKAGLRMLVQSAAKECRDAKLPIRINLVSPAGVKTPMWRSMPFFQELIAKLGTEEQAFASMTASGGGEFVEPDVVAAIVGFLVSDRAAHITGVELPVDSGYLL